MRRLVITAILTGLFVLARPAQAQTETWKRWYGWELIAADAAASALVLAPVDDSVRGATIGIGMTALFMNGAFVHMPNRNPKRASLSLFRLPAFLLGRLAGFGLGHGLCRQTGCKQPMQTWGGIIGLGGVLLWDWVTAVKPQPSPWAENDLESDPLPPARLQALVGAGLHPQVDPPLLGVAVDRLQLLGGEVEIGQRLHVFPDLFRTAGADHHAGHPGIP